MAEATERWEWVVRATNDGVWDWDLLHDTVYFSPRWKAMHGFQDHESLETMTEWSSRLHPEDRGRVLKKMEEYLVGRQSNYWEEYRIQRKGGTYPVRSSGGITLFGRDLIEMGQDEIARIVGVVPQDTPQLFPFTVAETVLMGRFPHRPRNRWGSGFGWESGEDMAIAEDAMRTMDVAHLAQRAVTDLSGGERQRTMIARALAQTPNVLLLDEPTAFLDLQHQVEIGSVLCRLKDERGLTVVLISHDLNLVSQYCDRLLLLAEGQVVRLGTPDEVIEPLALEQVYRCQVLIDRHPTSGVPRVTFPGRKSTGNK